LKTDKGRNENEDEKIVRRVKLRQREIEQEGQLFPRLILNMNKKRLYQQHFTAEILQEIYAG